MTAVVDGHGGRVNALRVAIDPIGRVLLLADDGGPRIVASLSVRRAFRLMRQIEAAAVMASGNGPGGYELVALRELGAFTDEEADEATRGPSKRVPL